MKFFEFDKHDYYALIGADDEEDAISLYNQDVADFYTHDDFPPTEITQEVAKQKYIKLALEDAAEIMWERELASGRDVVFLIDGSLV